MKDLEQLFDMEFVEDISNLVESKMSVLQKVKDFKKKDKELSREMEELDNMLPEDMKSKFDDVIRHTYEVEQYYFTLAYLIGTKYSKKMGKL